MPDQPPPYQNAAEVLDRSRGLFSMADHELMQALLPAIRDRSSDLGTDDYLRRAEIMAALAAAGADVAQAMMVRDDLTAAEHLDQQLGPYPTPLGGPSEELQQHLEDLAARPLRDPHAG